MSETASNGNGSANGNADIEQAFVLQQIYIKDLSFEAPSSPEIFQEQQVEPETELNIRNEHQTLKNNNFEVVLNVSIHAKLGDKTIFLIELQQAGIFLINGFAPEQTAILLGTQCPATLFPYARETISTQVGKGGFPPLVLQPINFESLYAQAQAQNQQGLQS
jgi:preprotein translocase subunit SecB